MRFRRAHIFLAAGLVILVLIGLVWRAFRPLPAPTPPSESYVIDQGAAATGTTTVEFQRSLRQGTQMHVSRDIDIALISVANGAAMLAVRDQGHDPAVRTVRAMPNDTFEITGYTVTVLEVKDLPSFSLKPGSGKDYVVLKFKKK